MFFWFLNKDINKKLFGSAGDSLITSSLVKNNDDSARINFKANWQAFIETQFQWKQFSFGARYASGISPFIKYTDPLLNKPAVQKLYTLNLFVRYELWNDTKNKTIKK